MSCHFHGLLHAGLCRQGLWRTVEVYLIRRERIQAGVWMGDVEEVDVAADVCSGLLDRLVSVQIDMLILDQLPEPLDENIVAPAAFAIHADGDAQGKRIMIFPQRGVSRGRRHPMRLAGVCRERFPWWTCLFGLSSEQYG